MAKLGGVTSVSQVFTFNLHSLGLHTDCCPGFQLTLTRSPSKLYRKSGNWSVLIRDGCVCVCWWVAGWSGDGDADEHPVFNLYIGIN